MATWTQVQVDEAVRKQLTPWQVSLYAATPTPGVALTAGVNNKLSVTVIPTAIPVGFDLFVTPQGDAIRFIGSGLGNGDSIVIDLDMHMSITATAGFAVTDFKCVTRPYTEPLFTAAVLIPGCLIQRKLANNDSGALAIVAPLVVMNDGDLLELAINPDNGITVTVESLAVVAKEFSAIGL